jgi:hypothetical protein
VWSLALWFMEVLPSVIGISPRRLARRQITVRGWWHIERPLISWLTVRPRFRQIVANYDDFWWQIGHVRLNGCLVNFWEHNVHSQLLDECSGVLVVWEELTWSTSFVSYVGNRLNDRPCKWLIQHLLPPYILLCQAVSLLHIVSLTLSNTYFRRESICGNQCGNIMWL